ncbi:MAG: hypothetical protein ACUZ8O_08380 [Candidatus Anammoxibacter sp.]
MEIIKCLEKSNIVKELEVLVLEFFEGGFYTKIKAALNNNTELYIREYSDVNVWDLFISLARTKQEVVNQMGQLAASQTY